MQDIGGVRVILDDRAGADRMVERTMEQWSDDVYRHDDYVSAPQPSGYRAHHIVVNRGARMIEIQVRTENQHTWAESVESSGRLICVELKWGDGPQVVHAYYRLLGSALDLANLRSDVPDDLLEETIAARDRARQRMLMMRRGGTANG